MKIGMICFTARGAAVCYMLCQRFRENETECSGYVPRRFWKPEWEQEGIRPRDMSLSEWTGAMFEQKRALVFIGAAGIAVRAIAPFVRDKMTDPPVVVADEAGQFCIPLLSGHVGGANELAVKMAKWLKGIPVITTATDVNGVFAVDVFAARNGLAITDREEAKRISARLLEGHEVGFFCDVEGGWESLCGYGPEIDGGDVQELPRGCIPKICAHNIRITYYDGEDREQAESGPFYLRLVPKAVVVGVGCRKGISPAVLEDGVLKALEENHIDLAAVKAVATIDIKSREAAVTKLADRFGWELRTYTADELSRVEGEFEDSEFVKKTVGVGNVCERACTAEAGRLLIHKRAGNGVTVAAAAERPGRPYTAHSN